jgi:O-methyltransferase involved in polyketide biosynthesis
MFPIINRGTWSRVQAYRQTILKFLEFAKNGPCNILSLGGGYDTTFFWLVQNFNPQNLCYIEVDYDRVVDKKIETINQNAELKSMIQGWDDQRSYEINSSNYKLFAANVCNADVLTQKMQAFGVQNGVPTLVLTECLLIYLTPDQSRGVLQWCRDFFNQSPFLGVLNYEMIGPDDTFGRKMVENLKDRGCELKGIEGCPDIDS